MIDHMETRKQVTVKVELMVTMEVDESNIKQQVSRIVNSEVFNCESSRVVDIEMTEHEIVSTTEI